MSIAKSASQIVSDFRAYMAKYGKPYAAWYVGIASEPRRRLFIDHNVSQHIGAWIHDDAGTDAVARAIEKHFLDLGCSGGDGGGDYTTRFIYAYLITSNTRE